MRMPTLLSGQTMTPAGRLKPLTMSLNLMADDMSTASMTLDSESPTVKCGNWVQVWAPNGAMCVMYIRSLRTDYNTGIRTIDLEHCFALLEETVLFGEITPKTMGGSATSVTATKAINYLLGRQSKQLWKLGACEFSTSTGWEFNNSNILSCLQDIAAAIQDCQWEFDMTSLPWTLSLKKWPTTATMEMRKNRNLSTMKITLDRSGMFTRVWPVGNKNLDISSVNSGKKYLDMNTSTWGIVEQVITDSSITSAAHLKAWAQAQLKKNAEPRITVSIDALELSQVTGESLDKLTIGRLCQVPLPDYGTTVTQRLSGLSWANCVADKQKVTVTLANEHKTITGVLKEKANSGSSGGKKSGTKTGCDLKDDEEKLEEFENADIWVNRDNVWAVAGQYDVYTEKDGTRHIRLKSGALLEVDRGSGVYNTVGDIISGYDKHNLKTDNWIDTFEGSALWTQRNQITGVCGEYDIEYYTDASGKRQKRLVIKSGGGLKIRRDNVEYGLYDEGNLTAGLIVGKINGQTSAKIRADRIILDGTTTINDVMTVADNAVVIKKPLSVKDATTIKGNLNIADADGVYHTITLTTAKLNNVIGNATVSNNTLTLTKLDGTEVTFSKATTLSGTWSGSTLQVKASPQNVTYDVVLGGTTYTAGKTTLELVSGGTPSLSSTANSIDVPLKINSLNSGQTQPTQRYTKNLTVSVNALLETKSITANGTYTPSSGKLGIKSVTVNVPDTHSSSMSITRTYAGVNSSGTYTYYGKLYYYNASTGSYVAAASSNYYWYRSSTDKAGTNTVYY